jgi:hypothetical protein
VMFIRDRFRVGYWEKPNDPIYAGHIFLSMRNSLKPTVLDRNLQEITSSEGFGSGDYVICTGRFFAYDAKGNKGVSFSLGNIQKIRSGERLDNRVDARTEFDALGGADPGAASSGAGASGDTGYDDL